MFAIDALPSGDEGRGSRRLLLSAAMNHRWNPVCCPAGATTRRGLAALLATLLLAASALPATARERKLTCDEVPGLLKQIDRGIASARADTAYDTSGVYQAIENHRTDRSPRVLIPPRSDAQLAPTSTATRERNRNIRAQARLGKRAWHTESGYSRRSLVESTFSRYKGIIGPAMRARRLSTQRVEARIGVKISGM